MSKFVAELMAEPVEREFCMLQECATESQQAKEAEAAELARATKLEAELAQAERELSELGASSSELDSLEERYWHDFNDFQLQLRAHIDERDVLVNKVCKLKHACLATSCFLAGAKPRNCYTSCGQHSHLRVCFLLCFLPSKTVLACMTCQTLWPRTACISNLSRL